MAVNKTLPDVQKALGDAFLPTDHVINQFNTVVVNTGRNLVLIDGASATTARRRATICSAI